MSSIPLVPPSQVKQNVTTPRWYASIIAAVTALMAALNTTQAEALAAARGAAASGKLMLPDGTLVDVKRTFVDIATNTASGSLIAAVVGKKVRVLALFAQVGATAQTLTFKRGSTAVSGVTVLPAAGKIERPFCKDGYFETAVNEAFIVTAAAGGSTTSFEILYAEVP